MKSATVDESVLVDEVVIQPESVNIVLLNDPSRTPEALARWSMKYAAEMRYGEAIIVSEDVRIAKVRTKGMMEWEITHIACSESVHGAHPKYVAMLSDKQRELIKKAYFKNGQSNVGCQRCDDGWIQIGSPEAKRQLEMARSIGLFKGIEIGIKVAQGLNPGGADDMLGMFLSKASQPLDASGPSDCQSERAFFNSKQKQEK